MTTPPSEPHATPCTVPTNGAVLILEPVFEVLAWLRYAFVAITAILTAKWLPTSDAQGSIVVVTMLMLGWSVLMHWAYQTQSQRLRPWAIADLVFTVLLTLFSHLMIGPLATGAPATGFWVAAAPLAIAIACGWKRGILGALATAAVVLFSDPELNATDVATMALLCMGVGALGFMVDRIREIAAEREQVHVTAAALAERQRLARIVHDGVLQVLAMVEREGPHLGPRGIGLAKAAHEQEVQLRALIQDTEIDPRRPDPRDFTHLNFAAMLDKHGSPTVSVASPAEPVMLEARRARELDLAVTEALKNVAKHAGPNARAWVLLEDEREEIILSIRDNGVGGDPDDFAAAMQQGRMGMRHSIYGRIQDLGGKATVRTSPGHGVEWEFRVPVEA